MRTSASSLAVTFSFLRNSERTDRHSAGFAPNIEFRALWTIGWTRAQGREVCTSDNSRSKGTTSKDAPSPRTNLWSAALSLRAASGLLLVLTQAAPLHRIVSGPGAADGDYKPVEEGNGPKAIFSSPRYSPRCASTRTLGWCEPLCWILCRIINAKTARSQPIGCIIWRVGQALLEQTETDPVPGRSLNRNHSRYLIPTNTDIPDLDIFYSSVTSTRKRARSAQRPRSMLMSPSAMAG